jgi:hypothetical protein
VISGKFIARNSYSTKEERTKPNFEKNNKLSLYLRKEKELKTKLNFNKKKKIKIRAEDAKT